MCVCVRVLSMNARTRSSLLETSRSGWLLSPTRATAALFTSCVSVGECERERENEPKFQRDEL